MSFVPDLGIRSRETCTFSHLSQAVAALRESDATDDARRRAYVDDPLAGTSWRARFELDPIRKGTIDRRPRDPMTSLRLVVVTAMRARARTRCGCCCAYANASVVPQEFR